MREMGMSITGEVRIADASSRRAVFLSTLIAVLLVASALTFGIYMTLGQSTKLARPTAAAAAQLPPEPPPPATATLPSTAAGTGNVEATPATDAPSAATTHPAPPPAVPSAAVPAKSAGNAPAATTTPRSSSATGKRAPAPAATGDI